MTKQERQQQLADRQLELLAIMRQSDAHASKCVKLGLAFSEAYPDEAAAYAAARDEYNANESALSELSNLPDDEPEPLPLPDEGM